MTPYKASLAETEPMDSRFIPLWGNFSRVAARGQQHTNDVFKLEGNV